MLKAIPENTGYEKNRPNRSLYGQAEIPYLSRGFYRRKIM
jgi:hypothetical protein